MIVLSCDYYKSIGILNDFYSVLQYLGGIGSFFVEVKWLLEKRKIKDLRIWKSVQNYKRGIPLS